jgi:hypothetical protein
MIFTNRRHQYFLNISPEIWRLATPTQWSDAGQGKSRLRFGEQLDEARRVSAV